MKLAIVGSRKFNDYTQLLENIPAGVTEVVSSGAKGADTLAERFADERGLPKKIFLPKFKTDPDVKYHPSHFHIRNRQVAEYADEILAFMPHRLVPGDGALFQKFHDSIRNHLIDFFLSRHDFLLDFCGRDGYAFVSTLGHICPT